MSHTKHQNGNIIKSKQTDADSNLTIRRKGVCKSLHSTVTLIFFFHFKRQLSSTVNSHKTGEGITYRFKIYK